MSAAYDEALKLLSKFSKDELLSIFDIAIENAKDTEKPVTKCDCPYCSGANVILYGKKHGKQRFLCKDCNRTFITTTHTMMSMSHYSEDIWHEVFRDTLDGHSLSFSENRLDISHQAAFNMRHKILLAMQEILAENPTLLEDVSELDETYVLECYKGKKLPENIKRKPRKHGAKAEKRGISNEYICLCTGVQRGSEAVIRAENRAKPTKEELIAVFRDHVSNGTLFLTDGLRGYDVLETLADCSVKNVEKEKSSFYHLNTVNNLHSFIKKQYVFYRGVATKYINRYSSLLSVAYRMSNEIISRMQSLLFNVGRKSYTYSNSDVRNLQLLNI